MIKVGIRSFVPGECAACPAELEVNLPQYIAKGQHAIESVEFEPLQFLRCRDRTMVGVVKQQREGGALGAAGPYFRDQIGQVPFVDEYEVGAVKRFVEIKREIILSDIDLREQPHYFGD